MKTPAFNYRKASLENFLKELGSASATPGGGSAAALTGALGAALVEMVIRINQKRTLKNLYTKKSAPKSALQHTAKVVSIQKEFLKSISEDAKAFYKASTLRKVKKFNKAYEKAIEKATSVPLSLCELVEQSLKLALAEKKRTSRWLMSDLKEAGVLLNAAFQSAKLNVEINFRTTTDFSNRTFTEHMKKRLGELELGVRRYYEELMRAQ